MAIGQVGHPPSKSMKPLQIYSKNGYQTAVNNFFKNTSPYFFFAAGAFALVFALGFAAGAFTGGFVVGSLTVTSLRRCELGVDLLNPFFSMI